MSDYQKQFQVTDAEKRKIEQNGGEDLSSVIQESDVHGYDWADVLKDQEPLVSQRLIE